MLQFNQHFLKKIPAGAEASNILVGEVDGLTAPLFAYVRLQKAVLFGDITEVPVPTRFMFILLGTPGNQQKYREIGRSIATLMSDEVSLCSLLQLTPIKSSMLAGS
jgi:mannitol/fructose-specific phosphotransferase system IIA component (Ntr-type)